MDDSTAWEVCSPSAVDSQIQQAATEAFEWSNDNLMCVNCDKTKELLVFFGRRPTPPDIPSITIKDKTIERVTSIKLLGVIISDDLAWGQHITIIHGKASQRLLFASFESVRCGKHSYCKDIRLTYPLAVGICLPSMAHGSYCVRFLPTRRDTEEGNSQSCHTNVNCQHQHPTLQTWRPVSPFF